MLWAYYNWPICSKKHIFLSKGVRSGAVFTRLRFMYDVFMKEQYRAGQYRAMSVEAHSVQKIVGSLRAGGVI